MTGPASIHPANPAEELPKTYKPAEHEGVVWEKWIAAKAFHANPHRVLRGEREPYCVFIPPPNVTAALHLGHALNNTLQDILVRVHRMRGFETLWMPGTDHAGIATQSVVEKRVMKEEKKRRTDFTREAFVAKIQAFKDEYERVITGQLQKMGCSCDWERQRFTMDEQCAAAVREAFFILFRDGLIYRGKRLVNWDPALQTAVADDECYDEEVDGQFYFLKYPLVDSKETITVATTRPETYLGDTAVAMNPRDPRAGALVGKKVKLPLVGREIPIIADPYAVLPEAMATTEEEKNDPKAKFSTGFVKMTPAHDTNDYEIGLRHGLAMVNMMSPDGRVSDKHGWDGALMPAQFIGKKMEEARKLVVEEFKKLGLFEGAKPTRHSKKFSDRSKAVIEPYLSDQWYVRVTDPRMAKAANEALHGGRAARGRATLRFFPERYAKNYEQWHDNIRDWCISRQLWWGHRVPVWSKAEGQTVRYECPDPRLGPARVAELERQGFVQDPDVLDTWFSSALWPLSTLGWPEPAKYNARLNEGLLEAFNPSSVLCTAREIITLWVSRMVMFNQYLRHRGTQASRHQAEPNSPSLPFRHVFIHAVIQDGEGRKMSKSLGNGVDPLDIIATHGADAMRFTLAQMATNTQDVRLPVVKDPSGKNTSPKFDIGRNLANKLWNAGRFVMQMLGERHQGVGATRHEGSGHQGRLPLLDRWMLSRLAEGVGRADAALAAYEFAEYANAIYDCFWRDFCDWYLEGVKPTIAGDANQRRVLAAVFDGLLRLMHPAMPFVTETVYERVKALRCGEVPGLALGEQPDPARTGLLCLAGWPVADASLRDEKAEATFEQLRSLVSLIRDARAGHQVKPGRKVVLHVPPGAGVGALLADESVAALVRTYANLERIEPTPAAKDGSVSFRRERDELSLSSLRDPSEAPAHTQAGGASSAERDRLEKLIAEITKSVGTLEGRLNNPGYTDRAPPKMVEETRQQLSKKREELAAAKAALGGM
jgi:valyl-tRNA synthetase